ncbi:MAG: hypothetical protein AAFY17_15985, partial [Cyanobacteria bacterium J06642_11]
MNLEPLVATHQAMLTDALELVRCLRNEDAKKNTTFYQRQQNRLQRLQTELENWQRHPVQHQTAIEEIPL